MNSLTMGIKKFFKNKNTVTIIGVVLVIGILYFGYTRQINNAVNPQTVPVAAVTIQPRTQITSDMVTNVDVASIAVSDNVLLSTNSIIGKYSNYNTLIPEGSMFYKESVIDESSLPDAAFIDLEEGDVPYNFPVTMDSTYGNSMYPGNYIDIYMKAYNADNVLMVGKLFENIKVLAVKDSSGLNVFENTEEARIPAFLIFGLSAENNILLRKASYLNDFSVELFPVPQGATLSSEDIENATIVSSQTLKDFINANTVPNDELVDNTDATVTTDPNSVNNQDNNGNNITNE